MGVFYWHTLGPLVPINHCLNTTAYLSIVADHVYPFMTTVYLSSNGYFQQDNAPCHKAQIISDWFLEHENEFTLLKWPPHSPDLNPIFTVIHAFITSRLDYCNLLYYGANQSSIGRFQMVQNAAARLLTGSRKFDHISPIFTSLHWLPVKQRIKLKILVAVFKALPGLAPAYLSDLVRCHNPSRALRSGKLGVLSVCQSRLKHRGDCDFAITGPKLWNSLPVSIRMVSSLSSFKFKLKAHLLSVGF